MTVSRTAPATAKYRPRSAASRTLENRSNLQADEDERENVQREHDRLPHRIRRDAYPRGNSLWRGLRHRNRVAHHRQHTREPNALGQHPDGQRADELKDDRGRHVLHTIHHPQCEPPERRADGHAASHREDESGGDCGHGQPVRRDGSNSEAVDQQSTRVVQQALAFEDRQDAMRRSQLAEHSRCGDSVGWRDDGAERNRRRPGHRRHERVDDDGNGGGGESDREYDQARHRRPVVPEISERRVVRRVEQHGGDEKRQRELGRSVNDGATGTNASSAPPSARNTGYGAPTRRAPPARITAATNRPRSCSSSLISLGRFPFRGYRPYCSSLTFSIQLTVLPSSLS